MGEIKSESIRRDQGACLFDMITQHLSQNRMEDMRGGVVARGSTPGLLVDGKGNTFMFSAVS